MINMKLIKAVPSALSCIRQNVLFQWLAMLCNVAATLILCTLMTEAVLYGHLNNIWLQIVLICALLLLRSVFIKQAYLASLQSSTCVKHDMRQRLFAKLGQIGSSYMNQWSTAEVVQLTTEGVEQLETYFAQYIPQFFYALLAPVTLFVIVSFWDWKAALALLVCVPLIPVSIILVQKFAKKLLSKYWGQYTQLSDSFLENLQGLTTLKIYNADEMKHKEMNRESENFRKVTMRVLIMQLNSISVMDLVAYGGSAIGILIAVASYQNGSLSLFGALAIILLSAEFFLPMRLLGSYFHISMNGSAAADKMFAILEYDVHLGSEKASKTPGNIKVSRLGYIYEGNKQALKNINFEFEENGLYGIVGESGCGKSTLAGILTGKLHDYQGHASFNGKEITCLDKDSLLENITILKHDAVLFYGTVRENLLIARADASDEELWNALEKAGIDSFLKDENGLDTLILEEASNLSGGQKQRIAFARALLKDSDVLLLDEATSSIDPISESYIASQIMKMKDNKKIIWISHRLANLKDADEILVLAHGNLMETGNHETLLENKGEYTRLWNAQQSLEKYAGGME